VGTVITLFAFILFGLVLPISFYVMQKQPTEEELAIKAAKEAQEAATRAAKEAEEEVARKAKRAEEIRNGFHCLSPWDGSHQSVKRYVRRGLRDPRSFEHVETRITPIDKDGKHTLYMTYRARNGFGGMNVGIAKVTVNNKDCSASIVSVSE